MTLPFWNGPQFNVRDVADGATVTDTLVKSVNFTRATSDTIVLSDDIPSGGEIYIRNGFESVATLDVSSRSNGYWFRQGSDTVDLQDSLKVRPPSPPPPPIGYRSVPRVPDSLQPDTHIWDRAKQLSGIVLDQNRDATNFFAMDSTWLYQDFFLPDGYTRGTNPEEQRNPDLTGFQIFAEVEEGSEEATAFDWTLSYKLFGLDWQVVAQSTYRVAPIDGDQWLTVYFDKSVPIPGQLGTARWRIGIRGRDVTTGPISDPTLAIYDDAKGTLRVNGSQQYAHLTPDVPYPIIDSDGNPAFIVWDSEEQQTTYSVERGITKIWYTNPNPLYNGKAFYLNGQSEAPFDASLLFRVLAASGDEGVDFIGNKYRSCVVRNGLKGAITQDSPNQDAYWLSQPFPSKFAIASLFFDVSDNGNPVTTDRILIDPITPGISFHVYYSNDGESETEEYAWNNKLWTPISQGFTVNRRQTFVLPDPVTSKFLKVEFCHLQPQHYSPGIAQKPIRYPKHPKWVMDYFLRELANIEDALIPTSVSVQYDALRLGFEYYLDDLGVNPNRPQAIDAGILANFFSTQNDASDQIDTSVLAQIQNIGPSWTVPPSLRGKENYLPSASAKRYPLGQYATERIFNFTSDNFLVSSTDRSKVLEELQFPETFFFITCRHRYRQVEAMFLDDKAYFAGVREIAFLRDHYIAEYDNDFYVDVASDSTNILFSDFMQSEGALILTGEEKLADGPLLPPKPVDAPRFSIPPSLDGEAQVGEQLNVILGEWSQDAPITYSYQWQRCNETGVTCQNIPGETDTTYDIVNADIGSTLKCVVTATNVGGSRVVATANTAIVAPAPLLFPPSNISTPAAPDWAIVGVPLQINPGVWTGTQPITYAYQWQRCTASFACSNIDGAIGPIYSPTVSDVGYYLRCMVSATNSVATVAVVSTATRIVIQSDVNTSDSMALADGVTQQKNFRRPGLDSMAISDAVQYSIHETVSTRATDDVAMVNESLAYSVRTPHAFRSLSDSVSVNDAVTYVKRQTVFARATTDALSVNDSVAYVKVSGPPKNLRVTLTTASKHPTATLGTVVTRVPPPSGVVLAAGDFNGSTSGPDTEAKANFDSMRSENPVKILGLGDYQYGNGNGTLANLQSGFDKAVGDLKSKIMPTAGPTHDVTDATHTLGYVPYWGRDPYQPYSFDIGSWHFVQLPSMLWRYSMPTSDVLSWLNSDLAATNQAGICAYWHEPYFTSSTKSGSSGHDTEDRVKPYVDALINYKADLILCGHQHSYERFAPQDANRNADPTNGIVSIVVGTGGIGFYAYTSTAKNSVVKCPASGNGQNGAYGYLRLTLHANSLDFRFVNTGGVSFTDSGTIVCKPKT